MKNLALVNTVKIVDKTKLTITINKDTIERGWADIADYTFYDEKEATKERHTAKYNLIAYNKPFSNEFIPSFTEGFFYYVAPRFVYRALRTIYTQQPTDKILSLMYDCIGYNGIDSDSFEVWLAEEDGRRIDKYLSTTELLNCNSRAKEEYFASNQIASEMKLHTYTMEKDSDGRRHKKECLPY